MASFSDIDVTVRIEERARRIHVDGKPCLCKDKIKFGQQAEVAGKFLGVLPGGGAQLGEYALDLVLLFQGELFELVVQIDDNRGLDKKGGTGGRLIVDHTGNISLVL